MDNIETLAHPNPMDWRCINHQYIKNVLPCALGCNAVGKPTNVIAATTWIWYNYLNMIWCILAQLKKWKPLIIPKWVALSWATFWCIAWHVMCHVGKCVDNHQFRYASKKIKTTHKACLNLNTISHSALLRNLSCGPPLLKQKDGSDVLNKCTQNIGWGLFFPFLFLGSS